MFYFKSDLLLFVCKAHALAKKKVFVWASVQDIRQDKIRYLAI